MGGSCSCQGNVQVADAKEETVPRPEMTPPVRVEPKKKRYRKTKRMSRNVKPSHGGRRSAVGPYGDIGSSSSTSEGPPLVRTADYTDISLRRPNTTSNLEIVRTVEKACGPADDSDMLGENIDNLDNDEDNTEDDSDISCLHKVSDENGSSSGNSFESNYVGSSDTDTTSRIGKASVSLESDRCVSGPSDNRQIKAPHRKETKQSPIKIQSKKSRCFNALLRRLGLRPTETPSVRSETTTVAMAEEACGINEDLHEEEHMEALGNEVTLPLTEIRSRKWRYFTAMMKKLGIRYSVSLVHERRTVPLTATTVEKAHGTKADMGGGDDNYESSSQNFLRSRDRDFELRRERMNALQREVTPPLPEAPPRNRRCLSAILQRLGCERISTTETGPDIRVLYTAEKACTTNDVDGVEDSLEEDLTNERMICEQNQMTASEEQGGQSLLVKIQTRKRKCVSALLKRLGLRWIQTQEQSGTISQTKTVFTVDKACGTRDDSDMFEEDSEDDLDAEYMNKDDDDDLDDDLDGDNIGNELEIHNIYERKLESDLSSNDSLHSYELVTDFIMDSSEELSNTQDDAAAKVSGKSTDSTTDSAKSKANRVGPPLYAWEDNNHIKK